jgi:hypothetical protein
MGMAETIYYATFEAGFVAVPAENYVDYLTNVISVPERHTFARAIYQGYVISATRIWEPYLDFSK